MTRRIALAFATVIAALLVLAVVPIGASMTSNEQTSFRDGAQVTALQVAAAAEEYLADARSSNGMIAALDSAAAQGDCVAVFEPGGAVVASSGTCAAAADQAARTLVLRTVPGRGSVIARDGVWLRVAVPVSQEEAAGTVILARSADPLDDRILAMWGWLCLTGVGALGVGVLLSVRLARWVTRPLDDLDVAAAHLGAGALDVRAPAGGGPAEVRRLAATFNQMAERTQSLVDGQQAWVADVSHQLRTPLTALRLRLDVLADETSEEVSAELAGAQEEIGRLSRLVDGLLAVARAQAAVPTPEPVRADELAADRAAAWEPVARERGISLGLNAPDPVTAFLSPGDLEQMLDNVLANALEAAADGGSVRIEAAGRRDAEHRDRIVVRVVDDGPGMSEAARQDAFRRYANPGARGNGLGLAIVYRLATANGGAVSLADTPGGGLTVELDLPAV